MPITGLPRRRRYGPVPSITAAPANPLYTLERACTACALHVTCSGPVPGVGDARAATIAVILEAPGETEDEYGIPATGATWTELEGYLRIAGLSRDTIWLTNTVHCQPAADPQWSDTEPCFPLWFPQELAAVQPRIIVACGQLAIRRILDDPTATVEETHGRLYPRHWRKEAPAPGEPPYTFAWVLPTYHPAAGFYNPKAVRWLREDFALLGRIKGAVDRLTPEEQAAMGPPHDPWAGREDYQERELGPADYREMQATGWCAVDTETVQGRTWSVQVSWRHGQAVMLRAADPEHRRSLTPLFNGSLGIPLIFHNAIYDAQKLRLSGFPLELSRMDDTLLMARLLESESAGLKALSTRLFGARMEDYSAVVEGGTTSGWSQRLSGYLLSAFRLASALSDPRPVTESQWDKEQCTLVPRTRKPQRLDRKIETLHKDWVKGRVAATAEAQGRSVSRVVVDRWRDWDGTGELEERLGPFPEATLADVDPEQAVWYSNRDADMTGRLYAHLRPLLESAGLWEAYRIDADSLPLVIEMAVNGIGVDAGYLQDLSRTIENQQSALLHRIWDSYGAYDSLHFINPGSDDQVGWLLYDYLALPVFKRTKVKQAPSVDDGILARVKHLHPVVPLILEWREMEKGRTAYCIAMPVHADSDGRIRCDLGGATVTGRIAAKSPNLLAVPNRTGLGRRVRSGLVPRGVAALPGVV